MKKFGIGKIYHLKNIKNHYMVNIVFTQNVNNYKLLQYAKSIDDLFLRL